MKSNFHMLYNMKNVERINNTRARVKSIINPSKPLQLLIGDDLQDAGEIRLIDRDELRHVTYTGFTIALDFIDTYRKGLQVPYDDLGDVIGLANLTECVYIALWRNGQIVTRWKKDPVSNEWDELL